MLPVKFGSLAAKFVASVHYCFLSHNLINTLGVPLD